MDSVDLKAILAQFSSSNPQADNAHAESELAKLQRLTQIQVEKAARNKPQQKEQPPNALLESYGTDLNLPLKDVQRVFDTYRNSDEFRKEIKAIRAHQVEKEQALLIGRAKMLQDQDFKTRQCETNMIVHITSEPDLQVGPNAFNVIVRNCKSRMQSRLWLTTRQCRIR